MYFIGIAALSAASGLGLLGALFAVGTTSVKDVRYILTDAGMRYDIASPSQKIHAHILMPKDRTCAKLLVDKKEYSYSESIVGNSVYVDFDFEPESNTSIEILF